MEAHLVLLSQLAPHHIAIVTVGKMGRFVQLRKNDHDEIVAILESALREIPGQSSA
jgi:hypothetical protein